MPSPRIAQIQQDLELLHECYSLCQFNHFVLKYYDNPTCICMLILDMYVSRRVRSSFDTYRERFDLVCSLCTSMKLLLIDSLNQDSPSPNFFTHKSFQGSIHILTEDRRNSAGLQYLKGHYSTVFPGCLYHTAVVSLCCVLMQHWKSV